MRVPGSGQRSAGDAALRRGRFDDAAHRGVGGLVLAAVGWTAWLAWSTEKDLRRADDAVQRLRAALKSEDDSARDEAVVEFQDAAAAARGRTDGMWWSALTKLPVYGDDAGTDTLRDIEQLIFSDDAVSLAPTASTKLVSNGTDVAEVLRVQGTAYADLIRGTSANEIFSGGDGADHFVFGDASGKDEIRGFQVGAGGDVLSIVLGSGDSDGLNASGLDTLAELKAQASQRDANVLVDLGGGHSVTLVGVLLSDLVDGNFEVAKAI